MTDHPTPSHRARELVRGAYDVHVHVAPDVMRRRIDEHGAFTVNVLASGQEDLSAVFAAHDRPGGPAAQQILGTRVGRTGNVLVSGALLSVDCRVEHRYPGGDHVIVLGRVEALHTRGNPAAPLVYHRGGYATLAQEVAA